MPYANGRLPASALSPIGGGFQLANEAAAAWNAMRAYARKRFNYDIGVLDAYRILGSLGDYARGRWSQWFAWEKYRYHGGNLAARPGTSNHGLGTTIDARDKRTRAIIDRVGKRFGWSKSWSDAPSEWWHIRYQRGHYKPAKPLPTLRKGTRHSGYVRKLQRLLRANGFKSVRVNGKYDLRTRRAIRRVQKAHHMHVDGVTGPATWRALVG